MNFGFLDIIPDYFGKTANFVNTIPSTNFVNTIPFNFGLPQLPKSKAVQSPQPNVINETKIQTFDTGNFQDFTFRAPLQSVLIAPIVEPVSVIPTPQYVAPVVPPIVQAPQAVPQTVWQPFYVPQTPQPIPTPSAPVIQNVQIVQPYQNCTIQ